MPRFSATLPKLVPALNRGMKAVDMAAEAQRTFLDELMRAHTALLQAARSRQPLPPPPAAPPPPPPSSAIAAPELTADARPILERGAVVEFSDADPPVRAKLTWISPQQTSISSPPAARRPGTCRGGTSRPHCGRAGRGSWPTAARSSTARSPRSWANPVPNPREWTDAKS